MPGHEQSGGTLPPFFKTRVGHTQMEGNNIMKRTGLLLSTIAALAFTITPMALAQDASGIDFGDDSGSWTEDGECDDPRFVGEGMAGSTSQADLFKDATDCKALFESGDIRFSDKQYDPDLTVVDGTDLGDDSYRWANDGECDDARFEGDGMAITPHLEAIKKDRSDCSYGFQTGTLTLRESLPDPVESTFDSIDFGNDKGGYAGDGECDDPRFAGQGMSMIDLTAENISGDRGDCLALYKAGSLVLKERTVVDGYYFGNDSSFYAKDGECDDPRFQGRGMGAKPTRSGIESDATDCIALWKSKRITPAEKLDVNGFLILEGIVFGDDSGSYANDNECDDPGFFGRGVSEGASSENAGKDKTDCLAAYQAGSVKRASPVPVDRSITVDGIRFGDDDSPFAKDGECDDPRFEGDSMAESLREEDAGHDATDCLAAFQADAISLK